HLPARPRTEVVLHHRMSEDFRRQASDFPLDVDVAVVAHNNLAMLPATLTSLADAGCPRDRITVVDVARTDGTGEWIAREWPGGGGGGWAWGGWGGSRVPVRAGTSASPKRRGGSSC